MRSVEELIVIVISKESLIELIQEGTAKIKTKHKDFQLVVGEG